MWLGSGGLTYQVSSPARRARSCRLRIVGVLVGRFAKHADHIRDTDAERDSSEQQKPSATAAKSTDAPVWDVRKQTQ
jgi:hypothetical protein